MADVITTALDEISLEDLTSRQRREKKELQAKIQGLKKNAPKSKRKEAMEEVARLEQELEQRHAAELKTLNEATNNHTNNNVAEQVTCPEIDSIKDELTPRISKAQKRRDKKEREAHLREEEFRAAAEEAQSAPKALESVKLVEVLKKRKLMIFEVPSDGDCLYNAVRHQLTQKKLGDYSVQQLREDTANYILEHKANLISYMTHAKTGKMLTDEEFEQYCQTLRSTAAWGGQIELKALSAVLLVPIEVVQAEGPPIIQGENEYPQENLVITYHRYLYSLGEHYNSTQPLIEKSDDDELYDSA